MNIGVGDYVKLVDLPAELKDKPNFHVLLGCYYQVVSIAGSLVGVELFKKRSSCGFGHGLMEKLTTPTGYWIDKSRLEKVEVDEETTPFPEYAKVVHYEKRRVVCAALLMDNGEVIVGIRHFSPDMVHQMKFRTDLVGATVLKQGFVDQWGNFMDRKEAYDIADYQNQIVRQVGNSGERTLYSEHLY